MSAAAVAVVATSGERSRRKGVGVVLFAGKTVFVRFECSCYNKSTI